MQSAMRPIQPHRHHHNSTQQIQRINWMGQQIGEPRKDCSHQEMTVLDNASSILLVKHYTTRREKQASQNSSLSSARVTAAGSYSPCNLSTNFSYSSPRCCLNRSAWRKRVLRITRRMSFASCSVL